MSRFETMPPKYFDELYAKDADPWRFAASPYERKKYTATLAALPRANYGSALEIGCSIGVLTEKLAARCDALVAVDIAVAALRQAEQRCAEQQHVRFAQMQVPEAWPTGMYDLILLSEMVYYIDRHDVERLATAVAASIVRGGHIVLVHWLGESHYPLSGDQAADLFISSMTAAAVVVQQDRTADYRLDVLEATSGPAFVEPVPTF